MHFHRFQLNIMKSTSIDSDTGQTASQVMIPFMLTSVLLFVFQAKDEL